MTRPDETPELADKRKMYVVVRGDLAPGLRAAQAAHAVAELCIGWTPRTYRWYYYDPNGGYLIILEVPDEDALLEAYYVAKFHGITRAMFREPDLDGEPTAFACLPEPRDNHLFAHLPLAYSKRSRWQRFLSILRRQATW